MGADSFGKNPEPSSGSIVPGLRHLPRRMHDQEKSYSPPLRRHGEREKAEKRKQEEWEQEKKEKCERYKKRYDIFMDEYQKLLEGKDGIFEGTTVEAATVFLNELIKESNDYLTEWECPAFPYLERPTPVFSKR
jgi:hypothetical protein